MHPIELGRLSVVAVVERAGPTRPTWLLPDATPEAVERHRSWLAPNFLDDKGRFLQSIHSFVVQAPGLTLLVDTCVGNDKDRGGRQPFHMMHTAFLEDLAAAGFPPESIDVVLCTHLHVDHVGWNTRLDGGRWVPTFPNARYIFGREEFEFWKKESETGREEYGLIDDSVMPIVDAGRASLVESDYVIDDRLQLEPSPGHTPGHVCVRLRTKAGEAVFTGDMMHRPIQVAETAWNSRFCTDADLARKTRKAFVERHADADVTILAAHFPVPGRIVAPGGKTRFRS